MFISVHGAVCEQSADPARAVQTARGRTAGSAEGNARQGPRPGEGEPNSHFISAREREQSVKAEQRQRACAAVNVLKMIFL